MRGGGVCSEHEALMGETGLHSLWGIADNWEDRDGTISSWQERKTFSPGKFAL